MSTFTDAERDAQDFAKLVNEDTEVTTRYGDNPKKSFPMAIREFEEKGDIALKNSNFTDAGFDFATGGTIETYNQLVKDSNGNSWQWQGSLPHIVASGTVPSSPDYEQRTFNEISNISGLQSALDEQELKTQQLRYDIASNSGASIVGTSDNTTVQFEIDQIKSDKVDFWYTAGDGVAPDLLFDATNDLGLNVTGSDVDSIVNLGKISQGVLLPTAATKSPIEVRSGFKTVKFDGSGVYDRYELTPSSFASGFFSATKKHFIMSVYVTDDRFIDTSPLSVGVTGSIVPRIDIKDPSTGSAFSLEYQDGTAIENLYQAATDRVDNSITSVSTFHNGIDEVSMWANGAVLGFKEVETKLAEQSTPTPIMNAVSVGSLLTNQFPLNGGFVAGAIDNNETLDLDSTYEKYKAAYYRFGGKAKRAFKIYVGGQSNAKGDFPNSNPFSFAAGEAYLYFQTNTGSGEGVFRRDGFTQGALKVGASCPAVWFAAELKKLIGAIPLYQDISRNGQPVSPGLPIYTEYQAPRNSVGDAAGQQSILDKWELDLVKMENLCNYSPEFNLVDKIAYLMCGESDAMAITAGATLTKKEFKTWANAWLNSLSGNYGIEKFAIVNIGRNGNTLAKVELNASAVELIREGWSEIISERADCYDVFPHLNHVPTPFVLDDLVTAEDGAWISGQANNADGLHYTSEMYKAIAITAARNFYKMAY